MKFVWSLSGDRGGKLASGTLCFDAPAGPDQAYDVAALLADALERALIAAAPPAGPPAGAEDAALDTEVRP